MLVPVRLVRRPRPFADASASASFAAVDEIRHLERALDRRRPVGATDAVEVREHEQVLLDRERDVEVVELRHDAALSARSLRLAGQPEAEHLQLALIRDRLRRQQPHRRRLTCAVWPEQSDTRPGRNVEIKTVHRCDLAVALHDAAESDRQVSHR
jgi:hypothetical protein